MKSFDEVIKALSICGRHPDCKGCPYENVSYPTEIGNTCKDIMHYDALYYMKEYQEKLNILKGKWQITSIKGEIWGICSNCNFKQKAGELNFCPNCGADMREDIPIEYFENGGI